MDTIPAPYFYFFWLFEPGCSVAGAIYAIFRSQAYAADMLPAGVERSTEAVGGTIRGEMIVGGLGNCFLVLAMVSLFILPVFKWSVKDMALQEKLMRNLLIPLGIADITHIINTLRPLPHVILLNPASWTTLIHGNVNITFLLLVVRACWLLRVGRYTAAELQAKGRGTKKTE